MKKIQIALLALVAITYGMDREASQKQRDNLKASIDNLLRTSNENELRTGLIELGGQASSPDLLYIACTYGRLSNTLRTVLIGAMAQAKTNPLALAEFVTKHVKGEFSSTDNLMIAALRHGNNELRKLVEDELGARAIRVDVHNRVWEIERSIVITPDTQKIDLGELPNGYCATVAMEKLNILQ